MALKINNTKIIIDSPTSYLSLPAGTTLDRPANAVVGMTRYNTDIGYLEVYTSSGWRYIGYGVSIYGDATFTTTTTAETAWQVPDGVTKISVLCIGAGGSGSAGLAQYGAGGGGGALAYANNISVTPGTICKYSVGGAVFATDGGDSYFKLPNGTEVCRASGGKRGLIGSNGVAGLGGTYQSSYGSGGNGGTGGSSVGGGGGAGGYGGAGGDGGSGYNGSTTQFSGNAGQEGGGGGGASGGATGGGGGGVGIYGVGANGTAGSPVLNGQSPRGGGGSGGTGLNQTSNGGAYGGGGGSGGTGANGVVRIIWGTGRSFPNNAAVV